MTVEEMQARIAELEKQVANSNAKGTSLRIGEKGGVSFYGVGRRPVTLYASQWETVLNNADTIRAFIKANYNLLKHKDGKKAEQGDAPQA